MTQPPGLPHQLGFAMAALGMTVVAAVSLAVGRGRGRRGPWRYVKIPPTPADIRGRASEKRFQAVGAVARRPGPYFRGAGAVWVTQLVFL
jgi:hypothetical protein